MSVFWEQLTVINCCWGCRDRTVEPNCHMTCSRYLEQKELQRKVSEQAFNEGWRDFWDTVNRNQGSRH